MSASQWTHDWSHPDEDGQLLPYAKVFDAVGEEVRSVRRCNVSTGLVDQEIVNGPFGYRMVRYPAPLRVEFCDE